MDRRRAVIFTLMEYAIIQDGIGAEHHTTEIGRFEVHYDKTVKTFDRLVVAFFFYFELDRTASLWDITEERTLIERKVYLPTDAVNQMSSVANK